VKVWILQTGEPLQIDTAGLRPMRAINLSTVLSEAGHEVTLWSSDFDHFSKTHRTGGRASIRLEKNIEIELLKSRGYKSNVGLSRLLDHAQLAWDLRRQLSTMEKPDVAFIGYPPIEPAWVLTRWLSRQGIPTVLDIKDAWPDVLLRAFPEQLQLLARVALAPYFSMMRSTFRRSTALASVAPPFLEWALEIAKRENTRLDFVAPLTAPRVNHPQREIEEAEAWWDSRNILNNESLRLYFVGTLNSAFDFDPIIEAAKEFQNIDFVIAGDGPQYKELHNKSTGLANFHLVGWINSVQAKVLSTRSDIAIAPLRDLDEFEKTIPNKFYDALVYGKPILTCIKGFAAELVTSKEIGLLYERNGEGSLIDVLKLLALHPEMIQTMSTNARLLYENEYSFDKVYSGITENLVRVSRA